MRMILFQWLLVSANAPAHHAFRAFVGNYTGNSTSGSCTPQWHEQVCGLFKGQGHGESCSHLGEHRRYKQRCGAASPWKDSY